jgi:hypothetical protein
MKQADLGMVLRYKGELHEVIGTNDSRSLILAPVNKPPCPTCGDRGHVYVNEHAPLFQDHAEPVQTLEVPGQDKAA